MSRLFTDHVYTLRELCIGTLADSCCNIENVCNSLNLPEHMKDAMIRDVEGVINRYFETFIEPDINYTLPNEY